MWVVMTSKLETTYNNYKPPTLEQLINILIEEKQSYSRYLQLCSKYQVDPDPKVTARYLGKMEILQLILQEKFIE